MFIHNKRDKYNKRFESSNNNFETNPLYVVKISLKGMTYN